MATVQHPAPTKIQVRHNFDWLWISLSVVLVALIAGAIAWAILQPTEVEPLPAEVVGFEYNTDATAGQIAEPGVTTSYFGYSGELYPASMGFEYGQDATPAKIAAPGVTATYFGNSGELVPGSETTAALSQTVTPDAAASLIRSVDRGIAASHWSMLSGFELDDDTTSMHIASPGVTTQYFGNSGELFAEE